jgi:cbb3-type cytochrome oxidase maturation protein
MSSLVFLIPLALVLGGAALAAFFWSLRNGQYDDLQGAAERIFLDPDADRAGAGSSAEGKTPADPSPPR